MADKTNYRNTHFVNQYAKSFYDFAIENQLMQTTILSRDGTNVILETGQEVTAFINCSYLGLDVHPSIVEKYHAVDSTWGVNYCCARSRFTINPLTLLEEELSTLFKGRAITFPSVTTTHMSVMPLISSGLLLEKSNNAKVRMIFDKFAHSSMHFLKPILATEALISQIDHNDLNTLESILKEAKKDGEICVYVGDGIYSMGEFCPIDELLKLSEVYGMYLYIDDAHGTSIIGNQGEGSVLSRINGHISDKLIISFCLSKGFGCNGGGILLPFAWQERIVRTYGQIYAFSASLDFSVINACLASVTLHKDGTILELQNKLRENVQYFDNEMQFDFQFSPIRMIDIGDEDKALRICKKILENGFFVSVVFFPIVRRQKAQLRICITANHSKEQIINLAKTIKYCIEEEM
jgi:7-keto-8-aminopelargonate synthetase-like enzyme